MEPMDPKMLRAMGLHLMGQRPSGGGVLGGLNGVAQNLVGMMMVNPSMFGFGGGSSVNPISPAATMSAYNTSAPSFTMPGFGS